MKINRALNFKIKIAILLSIFLCMHVAEYARANDLTHQWKSPAFSGSGYSSHVLTIENQEHSRKKAIREKREAAERERHHRVPCPCSVTSQHHSEYRRGRADRFRLTDNVVQPGWITESKLM